MKFKRVFLIILDSVGVGEADDAYKFNDLGSNTLLHALQAKENVNLPNLSKLGFLNLVTENKYHVKDFRGVIAKLNELSVGKDTLTGHYEIMGLEVKQPYKTFTDTGFPDELIKVLEDKWGRKIIGNMSASGTEIIKDLGPKQIQTGDVIVYTSADSVLQIAAHEEIIPLEELYKMCEIAREVTLKEQWKVARIIARPYLGNAKDGFYRTTNRKDYALNPFNTTYLNSLKENGYEVIGVGKIGDIFNQFGLTKSIKTKNNNEGMDVTMDLITNNDFKGLCFVNLVEFDSEYGHRRNPLGYLNCLEQFDIKLGQLLPLLKEDDLLILSADHGNDPTYRGTDHTREKVPFVAYHNNLESGKLLKEQPTFAIIGATIINNFNITKETHLIGESVLKEIIKE